MRDHLDWSVVVFFDEDVVVKCNADALAVVVSLKEQVEILLNDFLLLFLFLVLKVVSLCHVRLFS